MVLVFTPQPTHRINDLHHCCITHIWTYTCPISNDLCHHKLASRAKSMAETTLIPVITTIFLLKCQIYFILTINLSILERKGVWSAQKLLWKLRKRKKRKNAITQNYKCLIRQTLFINNKIFHQKIPQRKTKYSLIYHMLLKKYFAFLIVVIQIIFWRCKNNF